ncbi:MAG: P-loop NTPase [Thermovirgaceae bacterium]
MCRGLFCGRGGSGKSTLTALLARHLAVNGRSVCVIDADESNGSLHRMLGIEAPEMTLAEEFGGKEAVEKWLDCRNRDGESRSCDLFGKKGELHVRDLPRSCVGGRDNLCLVSIGKIRSPKEGCACPLFMLGQHFIESLHKGGWIYLVDAEAGVEHVGRGLYEHCDIFFSVLDPSWESVLFARFMNELAENEGKPCLSILNKSDSEVLGRLAEALNAENQGGTMVFPDLREIAEANLFGGPVPLLPDVIPILKQLEAVIFAQRQCTR